MPPALQSRQRASVPAKQFSKYLDGLKTQGYYDPAARSGKSHSIRTIAWNPHGNLIATGAIDKSLRVWNPDRPVVKYSTELVGHAAPIEKIAFNPTKEAELCSVSSDGVVRFWDVKTKKVINEVKGLGDTFTLAWAPDGESLIVGNKSDKIFVLSPTQSSPLSSHQYDVQTNQISFDHGGRVIFMSTGEGRVKILSYPEFEPVMRLRQDPSTSFTLNGHTSACLSVELQPTARWLATGGTDSIIALWDTTDWICHRTLIDMVGPVRSISFSFDGSYMVGGSDEGTGLAIVHAETGETVHNLKTAGASPIVAWHPSRYQLAYSDQGSLKILGVESERR